MDIPENQSLIKYPCHFPIKIVGLYTPSYRKQVIELVRVHAQDLNEERIKERHSKNKKYLSLGITVYAQSREQLDAIYCALSACDEVSWVL